MQVNIDRIPGNVNRKWALKPFSLVDLKRIMSEWQEKLNGYGWNALYFENHDQPRIISRWGNDTTYRKECAKAFATVLHGMQGTPYIYQGEEIGMTNVQYELKEYDDVEILNGYKELVQTEKTISEEDFMKAVWNKGRDNARVPMQWDDSSNAGFTSGRPWLKVSDRYKEINVKEALEDENSIFYYYKKLITLRHIREIMTEGDYHLLLPEDETLFVYERRWKNKKWLVAANLSEEKISVEKIRPYLSDNGSIVISNYNRQQISDILMPYEAFIFEIEV